MYVALVDTKQDNKHRSYWSKDADLRVIVTETRSDLERVVDLNKINIYQEKEFSQISFSSNFSHQGMHNGIEYDIYRPNSDLGREYLKEIKIGNEPIDLLLRF